MTGELKRCSRCKSNILLEEYFSKNRKGEYYGTCNNCRSRHRCDKCEYRSNYKTHLTRHIKQVHDKIKDIKCDRCEFKCSTSSHLTQHTKQVHDKIKDIKCDRCNYSCSRNGDLTKHKKICTGDLNISGGELACRKALELLDIEYLTEVCELKNNDGNWLRFDFKIHIDDKPMYIEYDGEGHFKPVRWLGIDEDRAIENFNKLQLHDKIKNEYCKKNNFPLLRIPYTEFENILPLIREFVNV